MRVEIMLYIYLFVCGAMIIFNIITALLFRKSERKTEKVSKNLRYEVVLRLKAAEAGSPIDKNHKLYLSRNILSRILIILRNTAAFLKQLLSRRVCLK